MTTVRHHLVHWSSSPLDISFQRFPGYWSIAAWLWLDLPSLGWWLGLVSWHTLWQSPAAVVWPRLTTDHIAAALWYLLGVATLVRCYKPLTIAMQRPSIPNRTVLLVILALATASFPFVSHDLFVYFGELRVMAIHHYNPMLTPVSHIPRWRTDPWLRLGGWQKTVNPYGPAWFLLVRVLGELTPHFGGFFLLWKSTALAAVIGTALVVERVKAGSGIPYVLHPVVGIELLANAHNDCVMMALIALAYLLWSRRQWAFTGLAAGLSVATKYVSVFVLVWLLVAAPGWKARVTTGLCALTAGSIILIPFWHGLSTLLGPASTAHLFLRSPAFVIQGMLVHMTHMPRNQARHWALVTTTLLFVTLYVGLGRQYLKNRDPLHVGDALLAAALVLMSWMQFWYITWALPFYLVSSRARAGRMVAYLAFLEAVRTLGWPIGLPAAVQVVQATAIWAGFTWACWPLLIALGQRITLRRRTFLIRR